MMIRALLPALLLVACDDSERAAEEATYGWRVIEATSDECVDGELMVDVGQGVKNVQVTTCVLTGGTAGQCYNELDWTLADGVVSMSCRAMISVAYLASEG